MSHWRYFEPASFPGNYSFESVTQPLGTAASRVLDQAQKPHSLGFHGKETQVRTQAEAAKMVRSSKRRPGQNCRTLWSAGERSRSVGCLSTRECSSSRCHSAVGQADRCGGKRGPRPSLYTSSATGWRCDCGQDASPRALLFSSVRH